MECSGIPGLRIETWGIQIFYSSKVEPARPRRAALWAGYGTTNWTSRKDFYTGVIDSGWPK
jgi:hypothetical protein